MSSSNNSSSFSNRDESDSETENNINKDSSLFTNSSANKNKNKNSKEQNDANKLRNEKKLTGKFGGAPENAENERKESDKNGKRIKTYRKEVSDRDISNEEDEKKEVTNTFDNLSSFDSDFSCVEEEDNEREDDDYNTSEDEDDDFKPPNNNKQKK